MIQDDVAPKMERQGNDGHEIHFQDTGGPLLQATELTRRGLPVWSNDGKLKKLLMIKNCVTPK